MATSATLPAGYRPLDVATLRLDAHRADPADRPDVRLVDPGSGPAALARLREGLPDLATLVDGCAQLTEVELTDAARITAAYLQRAEAALTLLTADAIERGTITRSTAHSPAHWIARVAAGETSTDLITSEALKNAGPLIPCGATTGVDAAGPTEASADEALPAEANTSRVPGIEPAHANRIAKVAAASLHARHRVMTAALCDGHTSVSIAHAALGHLDRVRAVLPDATPDQIHSWFLALPAGYGRGMVTELTRRIVAEHGTPDALDDKEQGQQRLEYLRYRDENDGMTALDGLLSGDHAAEFKRLVDALSAPSPKTNCCDDPHHRHTPSGVQPATAAGTEATAVESGDSGDSGEGGAEGDGDRDGDADGRSGRDPDSETGDSFTQRARLIRLGDDDRPPDKRRLDALMMIVRRVARWLDGDPTVATSGPAQMVVTVDYATLAGTLRPGGGSGAGRARNGTTLTPTTIRRIACDANIIPMVLNTDSEPLDVGRTKRLYTGGLRQAVLQKYGGRCTFRSCTRPAEWTQIHHAVHWSQGGKTDLANGFPLCDSDHDTVHRDNLVPIVTSTGGIDWVPAELGDEHD